MKAGDFSGLSSLGSLILGGNQLRSLPEGVFSGLTALWELHLYENQLTDLPVGVFSGLTTLKTINMGGNNLTSLREDVFAGLSSLTKLWIDVNKLSSLPENVFSGLSSLQNLSLSNNQLSSLPENVFSGLSSLVVLYLGNNQLKSLPSDVFSGLSLLSTLHLFKNQLRELPDGVFSGLPNLTSLFMGDNVVAPLPITVSLQKVADGQFKAVAPTGAPLDIVLPLSVRNGSITGGATTLTIPAGSVESEPLTVTRTTGTVWSVTVDIGTLPSLPVNHRGYSLVKSDDLPLAFTELGGSIRIPVQIVNQRDSKILHINTPISGNSVHIVNQGDSAQIHLHQNLFSGIQGPLHFSIVNQGDHAPIHLPNELFSGTQLHNIRIVKQGEGMPITFSGEVFSGLQSLTEFSLGDSRRTSLPEGVFNGLSALTTLQLQLNNLTSLPEGVFSGLSALTTLQLQLNDLTSLPEGVFSGLSSLTTLQLQLARRTSLPEGVFSGLSALTSLRLIGHTVNPMPLTVSLEKVGDVQFKAVAPTGAPFEIVLPVSVTNGTLVGGATTVTIPVGSVESEPLTVTRTPGTTAAVTVNIGTLPGIPADTNQYGHRLHEGYTLVKSTDLPLIFNAVSTPSETTTTLMAIKGTITNEDGTPAEAGLEVTVTIGSTTQTAVSEAGGVYSVIFLNTQGVVATSGDTVTVQVLNPNTGATVESTIQLSPEQITAKKATIDLQFSPSGMEYLLSVPEGISLIHVPLKVTAVDGATKTIESVADLYDALGGAATVSLLITLDPKAERWVGYFGSGDRGSSADQVLTDDLGIIAVMTAATSVSLSGTALGTNGSSSITLHPGMNLVGVPLKDSRITRVTDLFALEGIKDNVTLTIVSDNGEIKLVERAGDSGDIPVTGGQSFILVAREAATVEISGTGWSNVPDPAVAPSTALTGIEVRDTTPVLAVSGSILPPVGGASLPRLGVTDFSVTVKNLSTGKVDTSVTDNDGVTYQFTFVDIERGRAAQVGDILEITAQSPNPFVGVQPLRYVVTVEDVKRSHIPLAELVAYEIPATTELLLNYPNPFNPETWIPYRLAKDAFVTVTIYDQRGRVVRDIAVGHRIAAVYESRSKAIYWDGRTEFGERVASGIYFYTLTAGDYSATRKMVILK